MNIRKDILLKHLEMAAIEQITAEYNAQGFEVIKPAQDFDADLIVQKGDETLVFEIKMGKWDDQKRQNVKKARNRAVHDLAAKFNIVFVNLPEEPEIEIEDLESLFFELLPEYFIDEFSRLATHFWVDEVSDISFESIKVQKDAIEIEGTGIISLGLQYGSDSDYKNDDGLRFTESYSYHFHIAIDHKLKIKEIYEIELDSSEDEE